MTTPWIPATGSDAAATPPQGWTELAAQDPTTTTRAWNTSGIDVQPDATVQGETAVVAVEAPAGDVGATQTASIEGVTVMVGTTAWPGGVASESLTRIDTAVLGPPSPVEVSTYYGSVSARSGSGTAMPTGQPVVVTVQAHPGDVSATSTPFVGTTTAYVQGDVAVVLVDAPAGELVTGPPNIPGPTSTVLVQAWAGDVDAWSVAPDGGLSLIALTTQIYDQPMLAELALANGTPDATIYIFFDGRVVQTATLDGDGAASVRLFVSGASLGTHTVGAAYLNDVPIVTATLEVLGGAPAPTPLPDPYAPPTEPPMPTPPTVRWRFQSYDGKQYWMLPRNPEKMSRSIGDIALTVESSVAHFGTVTWQGMRKPGVLRFTGRVFTQAEYSTLRQWADDTSQRFYVIDHFERRTLVKVTSLSLRRVKDRNRRWHHVYEVTAAMLHGDGVMYADGMWGESVRV